MVRRKLPLSAVKTRLLDHQYRAVSVSVDRPASALFMDPGTGKSLTSLALVDLWQCTRILILCPAVAVGVWEDQIDEHAPGLRDRAEIRIMSYDAARGRQSRSMSRYAAKANERELKKWCPDVIVADEGHRLKGRGSKQSRMVRRLARLARFRLLLTGTPIDDSYADLWAMFDFLDPGRLKLKYKDFERRYLQKGGYMNYQVIGYRNVNELKRKVNEISVTQRLEDAVDLRKPRHILIPVDLEKRTRTAYERLYSELETELDGHTVEVENSLTKILRLHQMSGGFIDGHQVDWSKLDALKDLVSDWRKPFIVFARYIPEVDAIKDALGYDRKVLELSGRTRKNRDDIRRQFQAGKADVVVIQAQSGISITLTRATEAVFYSLDWSYITYKQNLHRCLRIGTKGSVSFYYLIVRGTHSVDRSIWNALKRKKTLTSFLQGQGFRF